MTVHGGDVWQVGEELGIAASEILDFSANVNPRGLPPPARERLKRDASDGRLLSFYPDPSARRLRKALSQQLAVTPDAIVIGPGAESLLTPILRCLQPGRALVPIPAFAEYRRVCEQEHIEFSPFPLQRSDLFRMPVDRLCRRIESESPGVVLLNNPHNPSGAMLEKHEVQRVLDAASSLTVRLGAPAKPLADARGSDRSHDHKVVSSGSSGATLVLDEAFIDYVPHASLVREAAIRPALIVIRSLTKFYGCPALRVGYAVAHPDTIQAIRSLLPTWPVTQLSSDALAEAVADGEYAEASLRENAIERERLTNSLSGLGLTVFPSAANYLFLELDVDMPNASELRARLIAKHRILIRNCDSYEGLALGRYVRVAVRSDRENCRLIQALAEELRVP